VPTEDGVLTCWSATTQSGQLAQARPQLQAPWHTVAGKALGLLVGLPGVQVAAGGGSPSLRAGIQNPDRTAAHDLLPKRSCYVLGT